MYIGTEITSTIQDKVNNEVFREAHDVIWDGVSRSIWIEVRNKVYVEVMEVVEAVADEVNRIE